MTSSKVRFTKSGLPGSRASYGPGLRKEKHAFLITCENFVDFSRLALNVFVTSLNSVYTSIVYTICSIIHPSLVVISIRGFQKVERSPPRSQCIHFRVYKSVCVCVCVCARARVCVQVVHDVYSVNPILSSPWYRPHCALFTWENWSMRLYLVWNDLVPLRCSAFRSFYSTWMSCKQ